MDIYQIPVVGVIGEQFKVTDMLMHIANAKNFTALKLLINSPGGDVEAADKIAEILVKSGKEIYSTNIGDVASAASRIFCVAPKQNRTFNPAKGQFIIHNPWAQIEGDASLMELAAKQLKKTENSYCQYYADRTGTDYDVIKGFMAENVPMTSEQIETLGFASIISSEIKPLAFINLTNNKMNEKQFTEFERILNKIYSWIKIKALIVTDVNGNELEFPEANAPEEILPGVSVMQQGAPATGEFVMADGSVYKCENGKLTEIMAPAPNEVEMLKQQIATLESEKETAVAAQASLAKELTDFKTKAEADLNALNSEYLKIKAQFNPQPPLQNSPSANSQGVSVRKPFKIK
jgi:ATP-dependent protease ClpP protease subunit